MPDDELPPPSSMFPDYTPPPSMFPDHSNYTPPFPPDLEASHGQAWSIKLGGATVASWLVRAIWAHPLWPFHFVSAVHLRPMPGYPPCIIHVPGATHEIIVQAVNPDWTFKALDKPPAFLAPINFAAQLVTDDDDAAHRVEMAVQSIIEGKLNPDTDGRQQWVKLFGDDCFKKEFRIR